MDSWEKFDETSLPDKKAFYSNLNLEDISDENYVHTQKYGMYLKQEIAVNIMTYMFKVIQYCVQMYLKTFEICVLIYMELILYILCLHLD